VHGLEGGLESQPSFNGFVFVAYQTGSVVMAAFWKFTVVWQDSFAANSAVPHFVPTVLLAAVAASDVNTTFSVGGVFVPFVESVTPHAALIVRPPFV
jgi:hypothetical protein